jgi:hypothetical protein
MVLLTDSARTCILLVAFVALPENLEAVQKFWKPSRTSGARPELLEAVQNFWKLSRTSGSQPEILDAVQNFWRLSPQPIMSSRKRSNHPWQK